MLFCDGSAFAVGSVLTWIQPVVVRQGDSKKYFRAKLWIIAYTPGVVFRSADTTRWKGTEVISVGVNVIFS